MDNEKAGQISLASTIAQDPKTEHVLEIYRQSASIYERAKIALGRVPHYSVSVGSTKQAFHIDARQTTI